MIGDRSLDGMDRSGNDVPDLSREKETRILGEKLLLPDADWLWKQSRGGVSVRSKILRIIMMVQLRSRSTRRSRLSKGIRERKLYWEGFPVQTCSKSKYPAACDHIACSSCCAAKGWLSLSCREVSRLNARIVRFLLQDTSVPDHLRNRIL
ncbi:hypothetical protein L207DRAFT_249505 [Hyaloscypha variabilis F]|jgi:hypothetical protein|uniref:Uncharacterized protein n=1 Tax=Hyaloscypha variabilis (strain UAMH 11265 / GT02V1 / F) TaxID=1149755 RepID=A0A2J6S345_HYAVF|nr:hypothetical protein L207DRAFT_249505 [Hyaloscypha variabilis F]